MEQYTRALTIIRAAAKHNAEFQNAWPWTDKEITTITVNASIVTDTAMSEARRARRASSNAVKIGNQSAACHFTEKAIRFDAEAQEGQVILDTIDTWYRATPIIEAIFSKEATNV